MDVTLRQLRAFLAVATVLNFRQAADELFMTQQAVSASIKQLETQLGCSLLIRSTRNVQLTEAGRSLHAVVESVISELDAALVSTVKEFAEHPPPLQLSFPPGGAGELMPHLIDGIKQQFPSRALQFNQLTWDSPTAGLEDGRCDIAILRLPVEHDRIHTVTLLDEPVMLATSTRSTLASSDVIPLADALEAPVVVAQKAEPRWDDFWTLGSERTHAVTIGSVVEGFTEEMEAIAANLGCGFVPALVSRLYARDDITFLHIEGGPRSPLLLAWRNEHPDAERFHAVVAYVCEHGGEVIRRMQQA